jgi:cytochrome b561
MTNIAAAAHERYDRVTIGFHWLTALLVVTLWGTTVVWNNVPREYGRAIRETLEPLHVSLGIALAAVLIGRLVWRLTSGRKLAAAGNAVTAPLSKLVHALLYALLAAQVGLGFGLRWLQGEDFSFFGLFSIPSLFTPDRALSHQLEGLHNIVGWSLIYVAGAHAIAALFHRYVLKDRVLQRMLPSRG